MKYKFCNNCVISINRPGMKFNSEGICFPCQVIKRKKKINWEKRKSKLSKILKWARNKSNSTYDCVIGVSGGKDSTRQALIARDELGLNPLLVSCTYPPEQISFVGASNVSNLISLGFDIEIIGPKPIFWKKLMKKSFYKYGNWARPTELALYSIPPRVAISKGIPLILLGENNALISGDSGGSKNEIANNIKNNNTLSGGNLDEWSEGLKNLNSLYWYRFPSTLEMNKINLKMVYLGYFFKDFNQENNYKIAKKNGLKIKNVSSSDIGALFTFEDLDEDFVHVNQLLKYFKFGFARVSDDASHMIRNGKLKRDEAIELIKKYEGKCNDIYIEAFCKYINISEKEFWKVANSFRNKKIWLKKGSKYFLKNPIWKINE
tara:strand:+ start:325 stop:1455 length:1131 start_codon:yes stop_codon:yes gene_type:complete